MLKTYEAMFILDPGLKKEDLDALIQDIESEISKNQGKIEEVQRMNGLVFRVSAHILGIHRVE